MKRLLLVTLLFTAIAAAPAQERPKPIRALLITGGCCHDYAKQKDILKKGIEERANVVVEQVHTDDKSTKPPLPIFGNPDYAKGFDVVIHDECAADIKDPAVIQAVLKPHRDGTPGVNLHCAMHCYRFGNYGKPVAPGADNAAWFEYLGLQSTGHGPQEPIDITFTNAEHPSTKGLSNWRTIKEELYNNIQIFPTATPLAKGKQVIRQKDGTDKEVETVVAWANAYGKTRVWNTSLGHNNETVGDARYLDLVTRGLLWACDKLDDNGQPKSGYGPAK
jgi:type 1 glutamine amidotransferase